MDGVSRAAGVGPTLEFLGKTYILRGRTCGFYAALEAEIVRRRGNPADILVSAAPALKAAGISMEEIKSLVDGVVKASLTLRNATWSDIGSFIDTPWGQAFELWWAINDPELTVSRVHDIILESIRENGKFAQDWLDEARESIRHASGELGNLIGYRTKATTVAGSNGEPSTANSPKTADLVPTSSTT